MKANEAPEKIILSADRDTQIIRDEWVINDYTDNIKIEYVRTDTFIEKACKFIGDRVNIPFNVESHNGEPLVDSYIKYVSARLEAANKMIDEFRNYMKGE